MRGATSEALTYIDNLIISIHAPREGCDRRVRYRRGWSRISIHAPREGCDSQAYFMAYSQMLFQSTHPVRGATMSRTQKRNRILFQSTHPVRGATNGEPVRHVEIGISIHAPREGCDFDLGHIAIPHDVFQSTHPVRGATTLMSSTNTLYRPFQSTHPVRGATPTNTTAQYARSIFQSTHPVRGATPACNNAPFVCVHFNPRTP